VNCYCRRRLPRTARRNHARMHPLHWVCCICLHGSLCDSYPLHKLPQLHVSLGVATVAPCWLEVLGHVMAQPAMCFTPNVLLYQLRKEIVVRTQISSTLKTSLCPCTISTFCWFLSLPGWHVHRGLIFQVLALTPSACQAGA